MICYALGFFGHFQRFFPTCFSSVYFSIIFFFAHMKNEIFRSIYAYRIFECYFYLSFFPVFVFPLKLVIHGNHFIENMSTKIHPQFFIRRHTMQSNEFATANLLTAYIRFLKRAIKQKQNKYSMRRFLFALSLPYYFEMTSRAVSIASTGFGGSFATRQRKSQITQRNKKQVGIWSSAENFCKNETNIWRFVNQMKESLVFEQGWPFFFFWFSVSLHRLERKAYACYKRQQQRASGKTIMLLSPRMLSI